MAYKISFRERASKEYLNSILWYKERSLSAAENFVKAVNDTIEKITHHPTRHRNTYKQFYEAGVKNFPFAIVYFIDEKEQRIVVASIFHYKKKSKKKIYGH